MKYELQPTLPPPANTIGAIGWARKHLFNGPLNSIATVLLAWLAFTILAPVVQWVLIDANWTGTARESCTDGGACWVFIGQRIDQFLYGFYPDSETWRLDLAFFLLLGLILWLAIPKLPAKGIAALITLVIYPVIAFFLLTGGSFGRYLAVFGGKY